MATEQREKLYKVLEFYQYDQKDYPVCITLQERSEADLVMLEYIMTSNTYKDDVEEFISDMAHYEGWQSLEEWYKDTMETEDEEEDMSLCVNLSGTKEEAWKVLEEYERQLQQACAAAEQMDKVIRDIKRP